jgi:hypothetical protein
VGMWDIGGCRCIVNNNERSRLKQLIEKIEFSFIRKEYDYITKTARKKVINFAFIYFTKMTKSNYWILK